MPVDLEKVYREQWEREHAEVVRLQREVELLRSRLAGCESALRMARVGMSQGDLEWDQRLI